jgi:hypothetical protein
MKARGQRLFSTGRFGFLSAILRNLKAAFGAVAANWRYVRRADTRLPIWR